MKFQIFAKILTYFFGQCLLDCNFDVQKKFVNRVDESCVGPAKKTRLLTKLADIQVTNKKQTSMNSGKKQTKICYETNKSNDSGLN